MDQAGDSLCAYDSDDDKDNAVALVFFIDLNCLQYRTVEILHDNVLVALEL